MEQNNHSVLEKLVALTTAIIAVVLAINSILGSNEDNDMLNFRGIANNNWAYFQSKSIKENLFENSVHLLEVERAKKLEPDHQKALEDKIQFMQQEIKRYETEKKEIKKAAEDMTKAAENANEKGDRYDLAEGFYQVALVLAALAILAHNSLVWIGSCVLGAVGLIITLSTYIS